jgi:hypothetical protein
MPTEEIKMAILEEVRPHFGSFRDEDAMLNFLYALTEIKPELFRSPEEVESYQTARSFVLPEFEKYKAIRKSH